MTKDEYMTALKNNIQSLTLDEQKEALQYYNDYFEDAGFDEEKVLKELGTPEQVAQTIINNFANALVKTEKSSKEDEKENSNDEKTTATNAIYYEFDKKKVKGIECNFGAAEVIAIPGKKFSIETRGIQRGSLLCRVDSNDILVLRNLNKLQNLNLFNHEKKTGIVPRILLTLPSGAKLSKMKISIGAGRFESKELDVYCESGVVETGAGNFILKGIKGNNLNIRCGMGNINVSGVLTGSSSIECGMGAVKVECNAEPSDYSYDAKVGLGDVKFNEEKKSGVVQYYADVKKQNHFSVSCGMGSVSITVKK